MAERKRVKKGWTKIDKIGDKYFCYACKKELRVIQKMKEIRYYVFETQFKCPKCKTIMTMEQKPLW